MRFSTVLLSKNLAVKITYMKKQISALIIFLIFTLSAHTQHQRLAVLPSSMTYGDELASICIDLFRDAPSNINYYEIGNAANKYSVTDLHKVKASGANPLNETKFIGEAQEDIPQYYKNFLEKEIENYKNEGPLTEDRLSELQDEVWAYNGMDEIGGLINPTTEEPLAQFEEAKENFYFRYNLPEQEINAEAIVLKLEELRLLREINSPEPILSDFTYTGNFISCKSDAATHTIDVYYDGVDFETMQPQSALINTGIKSYNKNHYALPDIAEFSYYHNNQNEFLLSFEDEEGYYKMNFVIANGRITMIEPTETDNLICYVK